MGRGRGEIVGRGDERGRAETGLRGESFRLEKFRVGIDDVVSRRK